MDVETIDVEFAKTLLALNRPHRVGEAGTNRVVRPAHIAKLAKSMLNGEWVLTNQGIGISVDNELIDGQHRLLALLLAAETNPNITIDSQVTWNLPVGAKMAVDINAVRRNGDFLAMSSGIGNPNKIAAALRLLHCYDEIPYTYHDWRTFAPSPQFLIDIAGKYPGVSDAYLQGRGVMRITSPSSITAVLTLLKRDRPDIDPSKFLEALRTGADLSKGNPILALREWCNNAMLTKRRVGGVVYSALIIRALNHWVADSKAQHLTFRETDPFPTLTTKEFYRR